MTRNLLVVDDLNYILLLLKKGLARHGYNVIGTRTAKEAMEALGSIEFHLALVDMHLQKSDGIELIAWLRKKFPEIPIMAMSGKFSEDQIMALRSLGISNFVAKPIDVSDISSRIESVLGPEKSFPQAPQAPQTPQALSETSSKPNAESRSIYALDDDPVTLKFLETSLKRLGYPHRCFLDPGEFLKVFETDPCFAAIIDIFIPGEIGGIETITILRNLAPSMPVLVITGKPLAEAILKCQALGVAEILIKPFEKSALEEKLRKLIRR